MMCECQNQRHKPGGRLQVLRLLVRLYESVSQPDWASICQCLMFLDDAPEVAKILGKLLNGTQVAPPLTEGSV